MDVEGIVLNEERGVKLTCYTQETGGEFGRTPLRPAVLILPGGGYRMCSAREADPVAFAFLAAGYQAFVLEYSVGDGAVWPNPLDDYETAMALIRRDAGRWGIYPDKVAVAGFSAGGHLAAVAATSAHERPDAAILGYAAIGGCGTPANTGAPAASALVDDKTPPCFVFASVADTLVPVRNSIEFIGALAEHGVSFESHLYAFAPHGFSTGVPALEDPARLCSRTADWVGDAIAWLSDVFGAFDAGTLARPRATRWATANDAPMLSLDCSVAQVLAVPAARAALAEMPSLAPLMAQLEEAERAGRDPLPGLAARTSLRTIMRYAHAGAEDIAALEERLVTIPNLPHRFDQ